eukprot:TRINITY_DN30502_c0_g1_i1.p1 TRINITY_DN30502_c0_g1~~TRINITY_DN30502_c0_g1_i1.p1  ORF type:complete len:311 (+),score=43.46 TRINITY_DN30502_c0_g1_i1:143-1075(+)
MSDYHGLLPRDLPLYKLPELTLTSRALVIGMGGGCDVFAAVSLAARWQSESPEGAKVLSANCISERPLPDDHEPLVPGALYKIPSTPVALVVGDEAYGSTRLECSVDPRGPEGSPFLIVVPKDGKSGLKLEEVTSANSDAVKSALDYLKVDRVIAVDLGGDSLTGGKDFQGGSFEFSRDRQVLHALSASGIAFTQIVFGPGCDGESSINAMQKAVAKAHDDGDLLGVLPLAELVAQMRMATKTLSPSRTPNILAWAFEVLKNREQCNGNAGDEQTENQEFYKIERHGNTQLVPWSWLTIGLAIRGNKQNV